MIDTGPPAALDTARGLRLSELGKGQNLEPHQSRLCAWFVCGFYYDES